MVQKADFGEKGVRYRLLIGPIGDAATANDLCNKLKSRGMSECVAMAQ